MLRLTPKPHSVNIMYNPKDLEAYFFCFMCVCVLANVTFFIWETLIHTCVFSFFPFRQSSAGTFAINLHNISWSGIDCQGLTTYFSISTCCVLFNTNIKTAARLRCCRPHHVKLVGSEILQNVDPSPPGPCHAPFDFLTKPWDWLCYLYHSCGNIRGVFFPI